MIDWLICYITFKKELLHICVFSKQWPLDSKFIEFEYLPEICHFLRIQVLAKMVFFRKCAGHARLANIRQPGLLGLARLANICQPSLLGLARLAKAKFCKYYVNLASLASLANLASVG